MNRQPCSQMAAALLAAQPGVCAALAGEEGDFACHLSVVDTPARLVGQALPLAARLLVVTPLLHRLNDAILREDPAGKGTPENRDHIFLLPSAVPSLPLPALPTAQLLVTS